MIMKISGMEVDATQCYRDTQREVGRSDSCSSSGAGSSSMQEVDGTAYYVWTNKTSQTRGRAKTANYVI